MMEEIRALAQSLDLGDGALLKLAGDVAHNRALRTVADLTRDQRLELYLFLEAVAVHAGRVGKRDLAIAS